jgi:hypothetical protein
MTVPPNYGGREFEEGLAEDLGKAPPEKHQHEDNESGEWDDNELHVTGQTCARCGHAIQPGEDARMQVNGQWVHEVCPA